MYSKAEAATAEAEAEGAVEAEAAPTAVWVEKAVALALVGRAAAV